MKRKKMGILVFAFFAVFGLVFAAPMETYAASYGPTFFKTEDGKYEQTIKTTSTERIVTVFVSDLYKVSWSTGSKTAANSSALSVRLCTVSTGNCTSFKPFYQPYDDYAYANFTDMIPGTYYVDIRDNVSGYYYQGYVTTDVY